MAEVEPSPSFGDLLRRAREAIGASRAELAMAAKTSPHTIASYEQDGRAPDQVRCIALAKGLRKCANGAATPSAEDLWASAALRHMERREPAAASYHRAEIERLEGEVNAARALAERAVREAREDADQRIAKREALTPAEAALFDRIHAIEEQSPGEALARGLVSLLDVADTAPVLRALLAFQLLDGDSRADVIAALAATARAAARPAALDRLRDERARLSEARDRAGEAIERLTAGQEERLSRGDLRPPTDDEASVIAHARELHERSEILLAQLRLFGNLDDDGRTRPTG